MTNEVDVLDAVVVGAGWAGLGISHALETARSQSLRIGARPRRRNLAYPALELVPNEHAKRPNSHAGTG